MSIRNLCCSFEAAGSEPGSSVLTRSALGDAKFEDSIAGGTTDNGNAVDGTIDGATFDGNTFDGNTFDGNTFEGTTFDGTTSDCTTFEGTTVDGTTSDCTTVDGNGNTSADIVFDDTNTEYGVHQGNNFRLS